MLLIAIGTTSMPSLLEIRFAMRDYDAYMLTLKERLERMHLQRPFRFIDTKRSDAAAYLVWRTRIAGYSEDEIRTLTQQLAITLPKAYHAYLSAFGHARGGLFTGSDVEPGQLLEYKAWAHELVTESGADPSFLTDQSVIFFFHQGYTFAYFIADTTENPTIGWYREGETGPHLSDETFIDMLENEIELMERNHQSAIETGGYFVQVTDQSVRETHPARSRGIRPIDSDDQLIDA
jgi:hypothetical protein